MITKGLQKYINGLQQKKYRRQAGAFLVEGEKSVTELLATPGFRVQHVLATDAFTRRCPRADSSVQWWQVDEATLRRVGTLTTSNAALAVVEVPAWPPPRTDRGWTLAVDGVNDPGNLGALVRLADWFGFTQLVCSPDTTDIYGPKAIQASMGSFLRVAVHYLPLPPFLRQAPPAVCGACLTGHSLHQYVFPAAGVLVLGSEAHGIRAETSACVTVPLTIPGFGAAESLNVALAGAIFCDRLRGQVPPA